MSKQIEKKAQLSFRQQILLSFSMSILLFALLGALSTGWMATENIGQALLKQGTQVTKNFSKQVLFPLLYGDEEGIKDAATIILGFPGIKHVAIYNKNGERIYPSGGKYDNSISVPKDLSPFSPVLLSETKSEWRMVAAVFDGVLNDNGDSPFILERNRAELIGYVGVYVDKTSLYQLRRTIFIENLIGVFCFALLFLFLLMRYIRQLMQPLDALASLMKKAESGDASVRSTLSGPIEINKMSRAFNTMIKSLDERTKNLEAQKIELQSEIKERLSVQRNLIDRETHLATVIENVADGILIISSGGLIESANSVGKGVFQYANSEIMNLHYHSLLFDQGYDLGMALSQSHGEVIGVRKGGEQFPLDLAVSDMMLGGNRKFIVICRDITEQKQHEAEFSQLFAKLQAVMGSVPGILFQVDKAGRLSWWNQMVETCADLSSDQLRGKIITDLFSESNRAHIAQMFDAAFNDGYCEFQADILTAKNPIPYQLRIVRINGLSESTSTLIGVGLDISTQIAAQETLQQARDAALEAVRLKSEFLANMSHEIRTPLNGLLGMLQLLSTTSLNDEQLEYSAIAQRSGDALLMIINEVLDFSKIEAGKIELEHIEYNINQLVDDVAGLYSPKALDKGLVVAAIIANNVPNRLIGDPTRLRQVLSNLVDNAIKFTETGSVVIRVDYNENRGLMPLCIQVSDSGCGVELAAQSKIFDSFVQADGSATRKFGGTGLGLAIAKQLIEIMGGELVLDSEINVGSTFSIYWSPELKRAAGKPLPPPLSTISALAIGLSDIEAELVREYLEMFGIRLVLRETLTEFDAIESDIVVFNEYSYKEFCSLSKEIGKQNQCIVLVDSCYPSADARSLRPNLIYVQKPVRKSIFERQLRLIVDSLNYPRKRINQDIGGIPKGSSIESKSQYSNNQIHILVAEDNDINQLLVIKMLERMGYRADVANNGLEAIALAKQHSYDLILMDCQMPELDGYQATKAIRQLASYSEIPIIAVTGNALSEDVEQCQNFGLDDHLAKPFKYEALQNILKKWLKA